MTSDDSARMREIRERAEKASPGPWTDVTGSIGDQSSPNEIGIVCPGDGLDGVVVGLVWHEGRHLCIREADAAFIAAARNDVPWLLGKLAEVEAQLAEALRWDDDPQPEDDAIRASHPTRTGKHETWGEAMRLVGARRSKGALVGLVNWLLVELRSAIDLGVKDYESEVMLRQSAESRLAIATQSLATRDAEIRRLRGALERIATLPDAWSTVDRVSMLCQVGNTAPGIASATLASTPPAPAEPDFGSAGCDWCQRALREEQEHHSSIRPPEGHYAGCPNGPAPAEPDARAVLQDLVAALPKCSMKPIGVCTKTATKVMSICDACWPEGPDLDHAPQLRAAVALIAGRK